MVRGKGGSRMHGQDGWITLIVADWKLLRAVQVSMCFSTCNPKLMSFLICWKGSATLSHHKAAMACCFLSVMTALSSSGLCINTDYGYSLFWA